jgi:hypothetical protein
MKTPLSDPDRADFWRCAFFLLLVLVAIAWLNSSY